MEREETEHCPLNAQGERLLSSAGTFNFNPDGTLEEEDREGDDLERGLAGIGGLRLNQDSQASLHQQLIGVSAPLTATTHSAHTQELFGQNLTGIVLINH